jgi:di/tricarboxylate transporter
MLKIAMYYICASIVLLMPFYIFLLYKIITKEYKNEIKKAKENQKKINN